MAHCESCGRPDPDTDEGYTECCNELVCYGEGDRGTAPFTGFMAVEGMTTPKPVTPGQSLTIRACCYGKADEKYEGWLPEGK